MISKRKKVAVRRTARAANKNKYFILAGIAAAGLGLYFFAGDKIKDLFKGDTGQDEKPKPDQKLLTPAAGKATTPKAPAPEPGLNIDKQLRKGSNGEEVKRLQFIINYIAAFRGASKYKTPSGYVVNFPIKADGDFGANTQAGAFFIGPITFRDRGYITLDQARKKLAYIAGYYEKPFPGSLVGLKNYADYQTAFKAGQIDGNKGYKQPDISIDYGK
jgi:hypothetical protein